MPKRSLSNVLLLGLVPLLSLAASGDYLIEEDGAAGPLPASLEFHHGAWQFGKGAMIGRCSRTHRWYAPSLCHFVPIAPQAYRKFS